MMVLASGVQAGDIVALSDPTASKSGKKETAKRNRRAAPWAAWGEGK